eukprot:12456356-Ditylum_brightwellii.AAC.1
MDGDIAMDIHPKYQIILYNANKVTSILSEVTPQCNSQSMYQLLKERGEISQISYALGSTTVAQESILIDLQEFSDNKSFSSASSIHTMDNTTVDQLFSEVTSGLIDLDGYLVSSAHVSSNVGVNEKHLSKMWRISPETAGKTLNVTA